MNTGPSDNFIQKAIKRPGALKKKAKKAGESTSAFARSHDKGNSRTAKQSRFAETLAKIRSHR
jgi:hypothetical protein